MTTWTGATWNPMFLASKIIRIENYRKQSKFFKIIITAIETLVCTFRKYINLFYVKDENYLFFAFYVKMKIIYLFFACILDTKFYHLMLCISIKFCLDNVCNLLTKLVGQLEISCQCVNNSPLKYGTWQSTLRKYTM